MTKLIIELDEDEGSQLGDAVADLSYWYAGQEFNSDGVWVKIGRGNQHPEGRYAFGWRITGMEVVDEP